MTTLDDIRKSQVNGKEFEDDPLMAEMQQTVPLLFSLMSDPVRDGASKGSGSLTFFVEEGRLKYCLADKKTERMAFCTLRGELRPFQQVEDDLNHDDLEWRKSRKWK